MRIIIIGGGIGGLATHHALRKNLPHATIIDVYEAYPSALTTNGLIGGGLSLAPNGQRALSAISPPALSYILARGYPNPNVTFRNNSGKMICQMLFAEYFFLMFEQVLCSRAAVHEALLVHDDIDKKVHWNYRVKRVFETDTSVKVEFEDGSIETCDLLIGADGSRSVCRDALYGEEYAAQYDGMTGLGGFVPLSSLSPSIQSGLEKEPQVITLSQNGTFGMSMCSHPSDPVQKVLWFCSFEIDTPPARTTPASELIDQLLARYSDWKSPYDPSSSSLFREILIKACEGDNSKWLILPRYFTPNLPHWTSLYGLSKTGSDGAATGSGRIILLGDSVHSMPPDGAQGVSCAVEDALALALILKRSPELTSETIKKVAKAYEDIRKPRVDKILAEAKGRADRKRGISYLTLKIREAAMYIMSWLPESYLHDEVFGYDTQAEVVKYYRDVATI
ncbi:FAD/NAD(P)-binding domain-containing protein [Dendrothele bispora CBS 962.96]|uniref:FAD/NAD(P)-binding domain-containing protein n=1 Tax=Dendrothele bispora (strain CBS 962.96) TaxID=1314807 RepID=A0A4S8M754_DENBC|nr:FAD/NAD(P)-binding domain-containing protein [Dendrothele bispora CBS 962.96]